MFAQQLINGLALGGVYALFAVGFGIVFSTMKVLNLAQGVYATWGAIVGYWAVASLGLPFWIGVLAAMAAGAAVAVFVDQIGFQPLRERGRASCSGRSSRASRCGSRCARWPASSPVPPRWGSRPAACRPGPWRSAARGSSRCRRVAVVAAIVVTVGTYLLLHHSRLGAAIRAVGYDRHAASIGGVDPRRAIVLGARPSRAP